MPGVGGNVMVLRDGQIGSVEKIEVEGKKVVV